MSRALITGGGGFIGSHLAEALLERGWTVEVIDDLSTGSIENISHLKGHPHFRYTLDTVMNRPLMLELVDRADVIFHLAAAVSAECEADFDLGMRSNLGATNRLLKCCRALGTRPAVIFASSVAAFGASEDQPLPAVIDDHTMPNPQSSYGIQKVIGELLIADYTRKGYLRGRTVRLMTVVVRPGRPNAAASGFLSAIIREPLRGERTACPVDPQTAVALASPARAIEGLLCAATSSDQAWGGRTPVNLPALTVTVGEMVSALERAAGRDAVELIDWDPDPAIARIVTSWPARFRTDRASGLGLSPDTDFDAVIAMHLAESGL